MARRVRFCETVKLGYMSDDFKLTHQELIDIKNPVENSAIATIKWNVPINLEAYMYAIDPEEMWVLSDRPSSVPANVEQNAASEVTSEPTSSLTPNMPPDNAAPESLTPNMPPENAAAESLTPNMAPENAAPESLTPNMAPENAAAESLTPLMAPENTAPESLTPNMAPENAAPESLTPNMAPENAAPESLTPNMAPENAAAGGTSEVSVTVLVDRTPARPAPKRPGPGITLKRFTGSPNKAKKDAYLQSIYCEPIPPLPATPPDHTLWEFIEHTVQKAEKNHMDALEQS